MEKDKKIRIRRLREEYALVTVSGFQNLLVAVDDSRYSLQAEEMAANLAKSFDSKVTVLHVVPHAVMHQPKTYFEVPQNIREELQGAFLQKGKQVIQQARALFAQEGVKAEIVLEEFADPADTILEIAKEKKSDTLILGNKGSSEIEDFALGGVVDKVFRHADLPVFIVKKRTDFSKILVAVDGSKHAEKALKYAVQLGEKYKSRVTLLNVAQTMIRKETAKTLGEHIVSDAEAQARGVKADKTVEFGHPAKTIIEFGKKGNYDLIALGGRGLNPVKRFFLGSVSDSVARHSPCSVLVVR